MHCAATELKSDDLLRKQARRLAGAVTARQYRVINP